MKKNISFYITICSLLIFGNIFSQDNQSENQSLVESQERFITLSQLENTPKQVDRDNNIIGANSVFIQQVGANNTIFSKIQAASSDVKLYQNGEQNLIDINETSKDIEKFITQNGDNNTVIDFSINPEISTSLEIIQEGSNLNFERFGSNELSKNLKFKMTGTDRTIILRNF